MHTEAKKSGRPKSKSPDVKQTSESIAEQTRAFLNGGGQITKIRMGVLRMTTQADAGKEPEASSDP